MIDPLLAAAAPLLAPAFTAWGSPVTWLEIGAFVAALAMVAANYRVHPVAWPLAIASSLAYALLFAHSRLYGEAALQGVFVALSLWGWWQWLRGTERTPAARGGGTAAAPLRVRRLTRAGTVRLVLAVALAWPLLAQLLARATDSDVPWLDALPTVASVAGQVLLARKRVENWPVWLFVNVVSVGLFAYKGLWLTVLLYAVFAALSVAGWRHWLVLARRNDEQAQAELAAIAGRGLAAVGDAAAARGGDRGR